MKCLDYVLKMFVSALELLDFALELLDFALELLDFALELLDFAGIPDAARSLLLGAFFC